MDRSESVSALDVKLQMRFTGRVQMRDVKQTQRVKGGDIGRLEAELEVVGGGTGKSSSSSVPTKSLCCAGFGLH